MATLAPNKILNGEFKILTKNKEGIPRNAYWIKLYRGVIRDCAPILREHYLGVHIKYLISFLEKSQGTVEVSEVVR